jgi:surfeit locus 1 family protein
MNPVRGRWVAVLAGAMAVLLTMALGRWQLQRASDKQAAAAMMQRRAGEPPWTNVDWPCAAAATASVEAALPEHQPARMRGHWVSDRTVFLDNRPMDGIPGFDVITPLRLSTGPCKGRVLLVQRGWIPRNAHDRQLLPMSSDIADEVLVPGRVVEQVSRTYALGDEPMPYENRRSDATGLIRQNAGTSFWHTWLGQAPLGGALLQTDDEVPGNKGSQGVVLLRHWSAPDLGVGKHQAYAAQWFAMSVVAAGLTLWFQFLRPVASMLPKGAPVSNSARQ